MSKEKLSDWWEVTTPGGAHIGYVHARTQGTAEVLARKQASFAFRLRQLNQRQAALMDIQAVAIGEPGE